MPFTSMIGNERSDKAFLELLKKETSGSTRKAAPEQAARAVLTEGQLRKLKLKESDVAKVTREGISHLQFHPTSSDLVIATGDKQGHIALWDVDKKTSHEVSSGHVTCTTVPCLDLRVGPLCTHPGIPGTRECFILKNRRHSKAVHGQLMDGYVCRLQRRTMMWKTLVQRMVCTCSDRIPATSAASGASAAPMCFGEQFSGCQCPHGVHICLTMPHGTLWHL